MEKVKIIDYGFPIYDACYVSGLLCTEIMPPSRNLCSRVYVYTGVRSPLR